MHEVKAILRPERLEGVVDALHEIPDVPGLTVSVVQGYGRRVLDEQGESLEYGETKMSKLETVVPEALLTRVLDTIERAARTDRCRSAKA